MKGSSNEVLFEQKDGVGVITLNRPDKRNALTTPMYEGIRDILEGVKGRDEVKVLVITGEGQIDEQTVQGKGPIGVARLASKYSVPTVAIVGGLNADDALLHEAGIQAVLPIVTAPMALEEAIERAEELVERAALRLGYLLEMDDKTHV